LTLGNNTAANRAWQDSIIARFPQSPPNATNVASRAYQGFQHSNLPKRDSSLRLDFNATLKNTMTARYQRSHQESHPGELIIGEEAGQINHQSNFGMTWTNIISSDTVQEARIGIGTREVAWTITDDPLTPVVRMSGGTGITFTILGNAGAFPIIRNQRDNQLVYNVSSARWAKHTLKLGTDLRRSALNDRAESFNRGFWSFSATCQGVNYGTAISAFWAGCVNSFTKSFGPAYLQNRLTEKNAYVQDDWRPTDNLVLNLGQLRLWQQQLRRPAARIRLLAELGQQPLLSRTDRRQRKVFGSRRLRHFPRPRLSIGLLSGRGERSLQPPQRCVDLPVVDKSFGSAQRIRFHAGVPSHPRQRDVCRSQSEDARVAAVESHLRAASLLELPLPRQLHRHHRQESSAISMGQHSRRSGRTGNSGRDLGRGHGLALRRNGNDRRPDERHLSDCRADRGE
jgi:hypothetical protein